MLMQSEIAFKDNVFDFYDLTEDDLTIIEEHRRYEHYKLITGSQKDDLVTYIQVNLRAAGITRLYKREGYDVLTYLGDLGGLLDVLLIIG